MSCDPCQSFLICSQLISMWLVAESPPSRVQLLQSGGGWGEGGGSLVGSTGWSRLCWGVEGVWGSCRLCTLADSLLQQD